MAWFRKKKDTSTLPDELQQYYQGPGRRSTPVAWLLALGTLIVTLLVVFALFWAGRWVYQVVRGNGDDTKKSPIVSQPVKDEAKTDDTDKPGTGTSSTATTTPSPAPTQSPSSTSSASAATANTQSEPTSLVNTGPDTPDPDL